MYALIAEVHLVQGPADSADGHVGVYYLALYQYFQLYAMQYNSFSLVVVFSGCLDHEI